MCLSKAVKPVLELRKYGFYGHKIPLFYVIVGISQKVLHIMMMVYITFQRFTVNIWINCRQLLEEDDYLFENFTKIQFDDFKLKVPLTKSLSLLISSQTNDPRLKVIR